MEPTAGIARGDSRRRSMHERFLAVPLWRLGAFEQGKTGLETALRGSISVERFRRRHPGSRGIEFGSGEHPLQFGQIRRFRNVSSCVRIGASLMQVSTNSWRMGPMDPRFFLAVGNTIHNETAPFWVIIMRFRGSSPLRRALRDASTENEAFLSGEAKCHI